jgi:hypothetical protein
MSESESEPLGVITDGPLGSLYDSGLYVITALFFICTSTPLYFSADDVARCMSGNLAMWIKNNGILPF